MNNEGCEMVWRRSQSDAKRYETPKRQHSPPNRRAGNLAQLSTSRDHKRTKEKACPKACAKWFLSCEANGQLSVTSKEDKEGQQGHKGISFLHSSQQWLHSAVFTHLRCSQDRALQHGDRSFRQCEKPPPKKKQQNRDWIWLNDDWIDSDVETYLLTSPETSSAVVLLTNWGNRNIRDLCEKHQNMYESGKSHSSPFLEVQVNFQGKDKETEKRIQRFKLPERWLRYSVSAQNV